MSNTGCFFCRQLCRVCQWEQFVDKGDMNPHLFFQLIHFYLICARPALRNLTSPFFKTETLTSRRQDCNIRSEGLQWVEINKWTGIRPTMYEVYIFFFPLRYMLHKCCNINKCMTRLGAGSCRWQRVYFHTTLTQHLSRQLILDT